MTPAPSLAERKAHDAAITGLAASSDGRLLATTSADKSVRLWDAHTGAPVATLSGHTAASWSPAFRAGGAHLATIGSDGAVRVWEVAAARELRAYEKLGNGMGAVAWSSSFISSVLLATILPLNPRFFSAGGGWTTGVFWTLPSGPYRQESTFVALTSPLRLSSVFSSHV
jgi:WD40 repeat protein